MKFIKYFFVGGIAALVDFFIFALFVKILKLPWFISGITGFVLATLVNYLLSIKHVFTSGARFKKHKEIMLIFFVSFIGLLVNQLILWQGIDFLLLDPLVAKVTATGIVFFWNYTARNHFIFKVHKKSHHLPANTALVHNRVDTLNILVIIILVIATFSCLYVYYFRLNGPPIRSDGYGYHAYLVSIFIDHDLSFRSALANIPNDVSPTAYGFGINPTTGKMLTKYLPGTALLGAPFFIIADGFAKLLQFPRTGYSLPYQSANVLLYQ